MASNPELFNGWTTDNQSVEEHVDKMRNIGCWGGHLEVKAAASILQKSIYIASDSLVPGQCKSTVFPDTSLPDGPINFKRSWIELSYTGACHYDGILSVRSDKPLDPPTLTGRTTSLQL